MKLYIIRHGETDWNKKELMQGRVEVSLNETGRQQIGRIQKKLEEVPIDAIYSSPMKRTLETAEIIKGEKEIPLFTDERSHYDVLEVSMTLNSIGIMKGI